MHGYHFLTLSALLFTAHGSIDSLLDELVEVPIKPLWEWDWSKPKCGTSGMRNRGDKKQGYIVGGQDAGEGEIPWQISIQRHFDKDNGIYHICGGTIINKKWVLTAAHCIRLSALSKYRVVAGTNELLDENKIRGKKFSSSTHKVVDGYIHEKFSPSNLQNDIALLRVDPEFEVGRPDGRVQAVCLPSPSHRAWGEAVVSGWGALKEGGRVIPNKLQSVVVPIISDEECRKAYGENIIESMLCAGYKEGMRDSCQGDSGGPLFQDDFGQATLIGVVSWGMGCARPKHPGVYTEVSYYIDWISRTMETDHFLYDNINKYFWK